MTYLGGGEALAGVAVPAHEASAGRRRPLRRLLSSDVGRLVSAGAIAQALTFAASPLLTRIYSPADFGVLAQYVTISTVLQVMAACRYDLTIPLAETDDEATCLLTLALCMTLLTSLATALVLVGARFVPGLMRWEGMRSVFWVLPLSMTAGGFYQSLAYFAARRKAFGELGRTKVIQAVGATTTQLALGLASSGAVGLVLGQLANSGLGITRLVRRLDIRKRILSLDVGLRSLSELAVRRLRFAVTYSASAIVNQLGLGLHLLLMGGMYGLPASGQLMLATRLVAVMDLVLGPIAQVYYANACEAYRAGATHLRQLFFRTSGRLLTLGAAFALGVWVLAPFAVATVFGDAWQDAGIFLRSLSILAFANTVASPISMTLAVLGRARLQLAWDVGRLASVAVGFLVARQLGLPPRAAVLVFSCIAGSALALLYLLNLTLILRHRDAA